MTKFSDSLRLMVVWKGGTQAHSYSITESNGITHGAIISFMGTPTVEYAEEHLEEWIEKQERKKGCSDE
ncbi:hypothetical protein [Halocatena marina]|nr:hypothetical protein [Halocatena marina]